MLRKKIIELERLVAKVKLDTEYAINTSLGNDRQYELSQIDMFLRSSRELFFENRIENLDFDVRNDTYAKWDKLLTEYLMKFPEYNNIEEKSRKM